MGRKKADSDPDAAPAAEPKRRRDTGETVAQVAYALRHRDAIVEHALEVLEAIGVVDPSTKAHVHGIYERGDARTRLIIQELIARTMRVPVDRLEEALEEQTWDADAMSSRALDALSELEIPSVDPRAAGDRVRALDVEAVLARAEGRSRLLSFIGDLPVTVHKVQRALLLVGVALLVLVGVALLFPDQAALIAFYGLLALIALLGGLLLKVSWSIKRAAKDADLDLAVLARLKPEERRILLLRRVVLRVFDRDRAGDIVERGLEAIVPDLLRGQAREEPPAPRAKPPAKRPARPTQPAAAKKVPTKPTATKRKASSGRSSTKEPAGADKPKKRSRRSSTETG